MKQPKLLFCLLFITSGGITQAQKAPTSAGGDISGPGGSVSYSVGQVSYTSIIGSAGTIQQGVQQPHQITVETLVDEAAKLNLNIVAYPNPTANFLMVRTENHDAQKISYQLIDMSGKLLRNGILTGEETSLPVENLAPAAYILRIFSSSDEIKTIKIIKN